MMRKSRQFRPSVDGSVLEERIALSTTALLGPVKTPVATGAEVTAALNGLHNALLSYQSSVTNATLLAESQITSGKVTVATAENLLNTFIGNKTSLLFFQARAAAGMLPYGAGFNGFVNSTLTAVGDLPSGAISLYSILTFPTETTTGPIGALQDNVFTSLNGIPGVTPGGDFAGMIADVNSAAIHATYATIKADVTAYVAAGVKAHDFTFHS